MPVRIRLKAVARWPISSSCSMSTSARCSRRARSAARRRPARAADGVTLRAKKIAASERRHQRQRGERPKICSSSVGAERRASSSERCSSGVHARAVAGPQRLEQRRVRSRCRAAASSRRSCRGAERSAQDVSSCAPARERRDEQPRLLAPGVARARRRARSGAGRRRARPRRSRIRCRPRRSAAARAPARSRTDRAGRRARRSPTTRRASAPRCRAATGTGNGVPGAAAGSVSAMTVPSSEIEERGVGVDARAVIGEDRGDRRRGRPRRWPRGRRSPRASTRTVSESCRPRAGQDAVEDAPADAQLLARSRAQRPLAGEVDADQRRRLQQHRTRDEQDRGASPGSYGCAMRHC